MVRGSIGFKHKLCTAGVDHHDVQISAELCTAGVQTSGQLCTVGVEVEVQTGAQRSVNRGLGHWPGWGFLESVI